MAKLNKTYEFKNAEVKLDEGLIYEFAKDDDSYVVHSLHEVLLELEGKGRIDFSIKSTFVPTPIEE